MALYGFIASLKPFTDVYVYIFENAWTRDVLGFLLEYAKKKFILRQMKNV